MAQTIPNDDVALTSAIDDILAQIRSVRVEMARDQSEIERLKSETAALKEESDILKAKTRAVIATYPSARPC